MSKKTLTPEQYAKLPPLMLSKMLEEPLAPRGVASLAACATENLLLQAHHVTVCQDKGRNVGRAQRNFDAGAKLLAQFLKKTQLLKEV